jgi:hypothetical protein
MFEKCVCLRVCNLINGKTQRATRSSQLARKPAHYPTLLAISFDYRPLNVVPLFTREIYKNLFVLRERVRAEEIGLRY